MSHLLMLLSQVMDYSLPTLVKIVHVQTRGFHDVHVCFIVFWAELKQSIVDMAVDQWWPRKKSTLNSY